MRRLKHLVDLLSKRNPSLELTEIKMEIDRVSDSLSGCQAQLDESRREFTAQKAFLQTLVETIPNPVFHKDRQGVYTGCNSAFEALVGKDRNEIIGKTVSDLLDKEHARYCLKKDESMFRLGMMQHLEQSVETLSGSVMDVVIHKAPLMNPDGSVSGLIGVISDVTQRNQDLAELEATNERLEMLLHSLPVGIVMIDFDTFEIVDINPLAMMIIGCTHEELLGKQCTDYICPAHEGSCPIVDGGQTMDRSEREVITMTGERVPVLKTVLPIELMGRKLLVECFVDISDSKRTEQERINKEKLMGVVEMAGAVCHEMNQPLQVLSGYCELLESSEGDVNMKWISEIIKSSRRLGDITRKLMKITRYETKIYAGSSTIIDIEKSSEIKGD